MRLNSIISSNYLNFTLACSIVSGIILNTASVLASSDSPAAKTYKSQFNTISAIAPASYHLNRQQKSIASSLPVLPAAVNLVKEFEGFRSAAYLDTNGLPVIGYGQTRINGQTVKMGQYITQSQASTALKQELYHIQKMVESHVKVELNPHQVGALTSLVFNAGTIILTDSTLIRKLNAGDYAGAAQEFPRWNKAQKGGRLIPFPGLTRRRLAEKELFLTPYQQIASN
ncbi:MAG: lysozyme [Cyanobacteria bacterium J06621_8]